MDNNQKNNDRLFDLDNVFSSDDSVDVDSAFANFVSPSLKPNNQQITMQGSANDVSVNKNIELKSASPVQEINNNIETSENIEVAGIGNQNKLQPVMQDDNSSTSIQENIELKPVKPVPIISNGIKTGGNVNNISVDVNRITEIKKKKQNSSPVTYNDGLDEDINYNRGIRGFLTNKKVISAVLVLAFIFVCIVVVKAFYFGNKVDKYEEFFIEIDHKIDEEARAYAGQELDNVTLKKVAASELVSCIGAKVDFDNLSDGVKNAIRDINNYYNQSYNNFAFAYKDIYTGFTVTYNENQDIFTASTIKAPTDIYIWEMVSQGKIDLDKELTYTPKQYCKGSGGLQYQKMYTKYKTRELLRLSTVISDNVAHNMLMDNYGRENMLNFWKEKGTKSIFKYNTNWGSTNAHDALIYMSELYRFYTENDEYGNQAMTNFLNAAPKFVKGKNGYKVANKSGWTGSAIHDASIIFADNPYIIIALSNTGNGDYMSYFNKANDLAYKLHTEYWKYKMSLCDSIKQY